MDIGEEERGLMVDRPSDPASVRREPDGGEPSNLFDVPHRETPPDGRSLTTSATVLNPNDRHPARVTCRV